MSVSESRSARVLWHVLYAVLAAGVAFALSRFGAEEIQGTIIGIVALVFTIVETIYWRIHDTTKQLVGVPGLTSTQIIDFERKSKLTRRFVFRLWLMSLLLKTVAAVSGGLLGLGLSAKTGVDPQLLAGIGWLSVLESLPALVLMSRTYFSVSDLEVRLRVEGGLAERRGHHNFHPA